MVNRLKPKRRVGLREGRTKGKADLEKSELRLDTRNDAPEKRNIDGRKRNKLTGKSFL